MSGNHRGGNGLDAYRAKRDPARTPEPFGGRAGARRPAAAAGRPALFVVQKHAARRTHYDLRLEIDGVLMSWAVPKGPSLDPSDKRLAMETEPHPLEYATFEGVIPAGNYGAGAMIVWDTGAWVPRNDPRAGLAEGKLDFDLQGYKLRGHFALVRTKGRGRAASKQWLLLKKADAFAALGRAAESDREPDPPGRHTPAAGGSEGEPVPDPPGPVTPAAGGASEAAAAGPEQALGPESVLSGLTVEELAAGPRRAQDARERLAELGAPRGTVALARVSPMLCESAAAPFSAPGWLFELKYDGYRLLAAVDHGRVALRYRSGLDATRLFPELTQALAALPISSMVLDGEVVAFDDRGRPSFQRLQPRNQLVRAGEIERAAQLTPVSYMVFDLLACEGYDLRPLALRERKAVLATLLPRRGPVRFADHIPTKGQAFFDQVVAMGLEGVVAKRADGPYRGTRSDDWLKVRHALSGDFAICGYTSPLGSRVGFGSLHLAAWDGRWVYVGRVGTGFSDRELSALSAQVKALPGWEPDFAPPSSPKRVDTWVEPRLVCEVKYQDVSDDGMLRFPVFLHLRHDKPPKECGRPVGARDAVAQEAGPNAGEAETEAGAGAEAGADGADGAGASAPEVAPDVDVDVAVAVERERGRVEVSNPDKVYWPSIDGGPSYRKRDLVDYYREVAPWLLPYLRGRPLALHRYPDGVEGHSFFQKDAPDWTPDWIRTETLWSKHAQRELRYFVCEHVDALVFLANMGTIPLHVWASRVDDLARPDWAVLDLDPKGAPFEHVVEVALALRALCEELALPCFVKTSGSTGLHVLVALGGVCSYEQSHTLAQLLAKVVAAELPDISTTHRRIERRAGRVYIDYVQNSHGRLLVAPLSVRPLPGAPVSMPLGWHEVDRRLDVRRFTIANALRRLRRLGEDPMIRVLTARADLGRALGLLSQRMAGRAEP
ncbi:DNA ligase D [Haliangium sp.]|uniref:DNA ligase D n=1 Tax=Haliangium sp. TaxID=2663208 RepID=UPI003D11B0BE